MDVVDSKGRIVKEKSLDYYYYQNKLDGKVYEYLEESKP